MKICSKFTGEYPFRSVISIKLLGNFIEIALQHGCFSVNLLHIFRTHFLKKSSWRLLLDIFLIREGISLSVNFNSVFSFSYWKAILKEVLGRLPPNLKTKLTKIVLDIVLLNIKFIQICFLSYIIFQITKRVTTYRFIFLFLYL